MIELDSRILNVVDNKYLNFNDRSSKMPYVQDVIIDITYRDIRGGVQKNCKFCPIALAATRVFGHFLHGVGTDRIVLSTPPHNDDGTESQIKLEQPEQRFIFNFDYRIKNPTEWTIQQLPKPHSFTIQAPVQYILLPIINQQKFVVTI